MTTEGQRWTRHFVDDDTEVNPPPKEHVSTGEIYRLSGIHRYQFPGCVKCYYYFARCYHWGRLDRVLLQLNGIRGLLQNKFNYKNNQLCPGFLVLFCLVGLMLTIDRVSPFFCGLPCLQKGATRSQHWEQDLHTV